jgi:hypothetical protein
LCFNTIWQLGVGLLTNPPAEDSVSSEELDMLQKKGKEKFDGLKMRAKSPS